jgi:hypothetical protein
MFGAPERRRTLLYCTVITTSMVQDEKIACVDCMMR